MKKNVIKILLLFFIVGGFTTQGFAEPLGYLDGPPSKQQRDRVRKRIETLKMWKLTKALDLDETTSAKLFPILNKYDKRKAEIHQTLREGMREMRRSLKENRTDQLKNILAMLEDNRRALHSINSEEWAEMKKVLTVEQQAQFILFRHQFDREVHKLIDDARERRKGRGGKGRGARP
jgi:Spy/CpxP family protein refolding chaperone